MIKRCKVPHEVMEKKRNMRRKVSVMQVLLLSDVDPNKIAQEVIGCSDSTQLHNASDIIVAMELLQNGEDVNRRNGWGETPLHRAVLEAKGYDFINLLLTHGADVNACCGFGRTPLHCALKAGGSADKEVINLLLLHGAQIDYFKPIFFSNRASRMPSNIEKWYDRGDTELIKSFIKTTLLFGYTVNYLDVVDTVFCRRQSYGYEIAVFTRNCINDLLRLMKEKICEDITWYHVATSEPEELRLLPAECLTFIPALFQVYNDIVEDSYRRYVRRVAFFYILQSSAMIIVSETSNKEIFVNHHCLRLICENLVNIDINNLLKAIYGKKAEELVFQCFSSIYCDTPHS